MKKILYTLLFGLTWIFITSGNPHSEKSPVVTGLEPYTKLLILSRTLPEEQRDMILYFIKNDQIIKIKAAYYRKMTANSKP